MKSNINRHYSGTWPTFLVLMMLALGLAGCEVLGPQAIRGGRNEYNIAINKTDVEQLLLNIVRMRANDRPYFLEIASITSTSELEAGLAAEKTWTDSAPDTATTGGALKYLQRPTIIYQPLTGEKFVRQLLEPINLHTILLLRLSGP